MSKLQEFTQYIETAAKLPIVSGRWKKKPKPSELAPKAEVKAMVKKLADKPLPKKAKVTPPPKVSPAATTPAATTPEAAAPKKSYGDKKAAMTEIISRLNSLFKPMDDEVLTATQLWAKARVAAIKEFKAVPENQLLARKDQWEYYRKLFDIAGGKTWYGIFNGRSTAAIEEFVVKNCAATVSKRNVMIASKLEKADVTTIVSQKIGKTKDGFNGFFVVDTDKGQKRVTIDTIRAGGYNIQCLHLRVLVKVK